MVRNGGKTAIYQSQILGIRLYQIMDGFDHSGNNVPNEYHGLPTSDANSISWRNHWAEIGIESFDNEIAKSFPYELGKGPFKYYVS